MPVIKPAALVFLLLTMFTGCRKKNDLSNIHAQILTFSARQGHIYNIFALDRLHTHSYNAVANLDDDQWTFRINDVDIMGETGELIIDPIAKSAIVIDQSTTSTVIFTNAKTNSNKTVQLDGAKFSIDFDNAEQAQELMGKSREEQRSALIALATDAGFEKFNISTH